MYRKPSSGLWILLLFYFFLSRCEVITSKNSNVAMHVDMFVTKSYKRCFLKKFVHPVVKHFFTIYDTSTNDTGRQWLKLSSAPLLNNGITFATFIYRAMCTCTKHVLYMYVNGCIISFITRFTVLDISTSSQNWFLDFKIIYDNKY